ncbi:MAG: lipid-binding SYLF domain-containing protein [Pseudomonadales bacterium]
MKNPSEVIRPATLVALLAACALLLALFGQPRAVAQDETTYGTAEPQTRSRGAETDQPVFGSDREPAPKPQRAPQEASNVLHQMRQDPELLGELSRSRGVFIIPDYAAAALIVGGAGGQGVMLEHRDGEWSSPVFFNIGRVSLGLQAGVAVGPIALLLMNEEAVRGFYDVSTFSLDAEAGLTVIDWSEAGEVTAGRGDVVLWTDMAGLLVDVSIAVTNINYDEEQTSRYYRQRVVSPQLVLTGRVRDPHDDTLQSEFAEFIGEPAHAQ